MCIIHIRTCIEEDSSTLAFSAASLTLCSAMLSVEMSSPCCVVGDDGGGGGQIKQRERGWSDKI